MRLSSRGCCLRTFQDTGTFTYLFFHFSYKIIKNLFTVPENFSFAFLYEEEEELIPPAASSDPPAPSLQSHHMSTSPFLQAPFSLFVQENSEVSLPSFKFYLSVCICLWIYVSTDCWRFIPKELAILNHLLTGIFAGLSIACSNSTG